MARYAEIKENEVISTRLLPTSRGNISGFNKLSNAELATYGYLPYTESTPVYDPNTHKLGALTYEIGKDSVQGTYLLEALVQDEITDKTDFALDRVQDKILLNMDRTDWTQLGDAGLTDEQKAVYDTLRTNLMALKAGLNTHSLTNLDVIEAALDACDDCFSLRLAIFNDDMTTFDAAIKTILA